MKLWKKILLILLAVFLLAQIPFVYDLFKIRSLSYKITDLETQRVNNANPNYNEFKGIIHAHTALGGHSTGTYEELLAGASENKLDFVVMTEHTSPNFDSSAIGFRGIQKGILFVQGNELSTLDDNRFLLVPGAAEAHSFNLQNAPEFVGAAHNSNRLALVTYPYRFKAWETDFDGIEVFSLHTNAKKMNPVFFFFDVLWSFYPYPELTLANYFVRPDEHLNKYDEISAKRKLTLFAGSDAHSNIGFHLFGDDAGNKLINFKFDDYATVFRLVRTHVLLEKEKQLTQENLLEAIKNGHCFVGFDVLGDTSGFSFTAENATTTVIQGDEINLANGVKLKAVAPNNARFVIFKNGSKIAESEQTNEFIFDAKEIGTYRTEVYLDSLGSPFDKMPWIISNPVYVK
jgi:hypothetical protein